MDDDLRYRSLPIGNPSRLQFGLQNFFYLRQSFGELSEKIFCVLSKARCLMQEFLQAGKKEWLITNVTYKHNFAIVQ